jgi:flagellar biosynthesis protein FlhB
MAFPPSEKRRREARARGQVAHSPLLTSAAALAAASLAAWATGRGAAARLGELLRRALGGGLAPTRALDEALRAGAAIVLPIAGAAWLAAALAGAAQTGGLFTVGALGHRRADAERQAMPWLLAAALGLVLALSAAPTARALAPATSVGGAATATAATLAALAWRALVVFAACGLFDFALRRAAVERALEMTRAEHERERREEEGDPRLRAERRRRHRALGGSALVDEVARAEVVVTAPGRAAALRREAGVPTVLAAGEELQAARLADVARRLGVPVRADDALADALAGLRAGDPVPPPHRERAAALAAAARGLSRAEPG